MRNKLSLLSMIAVMFFAATLSSCTENYSQGERIGFLTKFSNKGYVWSSYEGELNLTQTGNNTSSLFEFSIDNDNADPRIIALLDSAATNGWKIKIKYHQVGELKNIFHNRGHSDCFVKDVEVLNRNTAGSNNATIGNMQAPAQVYNQVYNTGSGGIRDTMYVIVIDKSRIKDLK